MNSVHFFVRNYIHRVKSVKLNCCKEKVFSCSFSQKYISVHLPSLLTHSHAENANGLGTFQLYLKFYLATHLLLYSIVEHMLRGL